MLRLSWHASFEPFQQPQRTWKKIAKALAPKIEWALTSKETTMPHARQLAKIAYLAFLYQRFTSMRGNSRIKTLVPPDTFRDIYKKANDIYRYNRAFYSHSKQPGVTPKDTHTIGQINPPYWLEEGKSIYNIDVCEFDQAWQYPLIIPHYENYSHLVPRGDRRNLLDLVF